MMTKKTMWRGTTVVVAGGLLAGALVMSPAEAEAPSFAVSTSASTVGIGDEVTVTVAAENVSDVFAYELALDYDTSRLAYVEDTASTDVSGSTYASVVGGDLTVLHTKLGTSPAATGDVALVSATFRALKSGAAAVAVPSLKLVGTNGEAASVDEVESASVTVTKSGAPTVVKAPKISGKAQVGRVLSVSAGTWSVKGVSTKVQWLRSGKAIKGATRSTYRLTTADYRRSVSAKVTASKAESVDGIAKAKAVKVTSRAASRTSVKAATSVKAGATWKARVAVKATGVSPKGRVNVYVRGKLVKKVKVTGGSATVRLKLKGKKGATSVRFVYVPETGVAKSAKTVKVRLR